MSVARGFTAITGATFTAAQFNTNVRDTLTELCVFTTAGDLVYATGADTLARLGIGAAGTVLTSAGGFPTWAAGVPAGATIDYAGSSAPSGWLVCDGSAVNRSTYAELFAAIGTTFGAGNGSTTFNLPDARGRTSIGAGTGSGLTARTLGATVGEENHALSSAENAAHGHQYTRTRNDTAHAAASGSQYGVVFDEDNPNTGNSGSGTAHNNMQPSLVLNKIIKI